MAIIKKLIEVYNEYGIKGLKQEIKDLGLHKRARCKLSEIVAMVLEEIKLKG